MLSDLVFELVKAPVCAVLGCSTANAVAPGEEGQARVGYGEQAVQIAATIAGAKLLGAAAGVVGAEAGAAAGGATEEAVVTLWKAPQAGRKGVVSEVMRGFSKEHYPGDGPFFSLEKSVAQKYQHHYRNGLQELNLLQRTYDDLMGRGIIRVDPFERASVHVPAGGLDAFNEAIQLGPPNVYHP